MLALFVFSTVVVFLVFRIYFCYGTDCPLLTVCVCACMRVPLSVFSPKQERRRKDEAVRATIMQKLIETGERERLKDLLRERLIQCGWRDELKVSIICT